MADGLIRSSPGFLKVPVELAREQPPASPWRGADGRLYTPGEIVGREGHIVGAKPGELIAAGVVWISEATLAQASLHGWKSNGQTAEGLAQVERTF